jgi:hypothetical protein
MVPFESGGRTIGILGSRENGSRERAPVAVA